MRNIELLAPAGNMNALMAAVENGADAVYLGGKSFNARQYAGNFDDDEIKKAVEYCHIKGVKLYVTLNILLKDRELYEVPRYAAFLYNEGVDALIIQDMGVGQLLKNILPDLELHASTQMTAHNLQTVNLLYEMGYKRVVLSRELSIEEIEHIASNTEAELEVFTHGALCISYSGQCLMSSMIGGRSGNRGRCAQPCRQKYILQEGNEAMGEGYILSPKDLCTILHLDRILEAKVASLKIEGRMKRPEYVAEVVSVYKRAIDSYNTTGRAQVTDRDIKGLMKVFNRGGFTTAHLFEKGGSEMMSFERPKNWGVLVGTISEIFYNSGKMEVILDDELSKGDGIEVWIKDGGNKGYTVDEMAIKGKAVNRGAAGEKVVLDYRGGQKGDSIYKTLDAELMEALEKTYKRTDPLRKIPINFSVQIEAGRPSCISIQDGAGNIAEVKGPIAEAALNVPLTSDKIRAQVTKLGGTPFAADNVDISLGTGLSLPASIINNMRREAVNELIGFRLGMLKPAEIDIEEVNARANVILSRSKNKSHKEIRISVYLKDSSLVDSAIDGGADIIIFGGDKLRGYDFDYRRAIEKCRRRGIEIYLASPRIVKKEFEHIARELDEGSENGADGIYAENAGILKYAIDRGIPFASGFSMNVFNLLSARVLEGLGSRFFSISPELSLKDIRHVAPYVENCEAICYGRVEMMVSEYCPVGALDYGRCRNDGKGSLCVSDSISLVDRMGACFPVKTDVYCRSHIYNSKVLSMLENIKDLADSGVNLLRINILDEGPQDVYRIVSAFKQCSSYHVNARKEYEDVVDYVKEFVKEKGYTKGHYYRGAK